MVLVVDIEAVGQEEVDTNQHVRPVQRQVGDLHPGLFDRLAADVDRVESRPPGASAALPQAVSKAVRGRRGAVGRYPDALGSRQRQHRDHRAGVEQCLDLHPVDFDRPDGVPLPGVHWFDLHDRDGLGTGPICHARRLAALSLHQSDGAVRQIIFDVCQPQDVLAELPRITEVATANRKVDMRNCLAPDAQLLGCGRAERRIATDPLEPDTGGDVADRQAVFQRVRLGDGAEKGAAIENETRVAAIDLRRHDRPAARHGHLRTADAAPNQRDMNFPHYRPGAARREGVTGYAGIPRRHARRK